MWVEIAKPASGIASVSYAEAVEVALCYGWIDGRKTAVDEKSWKQRFTPRRPRSRWSKINRDKATALLARGEVQPAGLREIEAAHAILYRVQDAKMPATRSRRIETFVTMCAEHRTVHPRVSGPS